MVESRVSKTPSDIGKEGIFGIWNNKGKSAANLHPRRDTSTWTSPMFPRPRTLVIGRIFVYYLVQSSFNEKVIVSLEFEMRVRKLEVCVDQ